VGDEEDPPFELAAGHGFGDVVEQGGEAQALHAVSGNAGAEAFHPQLLLHAPDDLKDVVQGVQVVVRAAFEAAGEGELRDRFQESGGIYGWFEGGEERLP